jgi:hypothetical protein
MPKTFNLLRNKRVVFFYGDDHILKLIQRFCNTPYFIPIKIDVCDLPTYTITKSYVESCKKQNNNYLIENHDGKGLSHYRRDYKGSGEVNYRKLIAIWLSKIFLIEKIIHENPFHTENFAWIDASFGRTGMNINNLTFDPLKINTISSRLKYIGKQIYSKAGFMISSQNTWLTFIPLYKEKIEVLKDSNYAHDEETIIFNIYMDNPNLFGHVIHKNAKPTVTPSGKCIKLTCNFLKHTNPSNNGGTHCCFSCKKNNGTHGPLCAKTLYNANADVVR